MPEAQQGENPAEEEDLVDYIAKSVPPHIWVCLGAIVMMLFLGLSFTRRLPARVDTAPADVAGEEMLRGRVASVEAAQPSSGADQSARVLVDITQGGQAGQQVEIQQNGNVTVLVGETSVRPGDEVLVEHLSGGSQGDRYVISDFYRLPSLLVLILVFAAATIAVGRWVGLRALISIGMSVLAIFSFIVPGIASGHDPLMVCLAGSLLLMTATIYLTYEWQWKTHAAAFSIGICLLASALLSIIFANLGHLTGFSSDESAMLVQSSPVPIDMRGLLMGSVLIGAAGILGDAVVSQASSAFELKSANPGLTWRRLFQHTMVIGRDHIASMVNTLLLAYTSAALPLLLLVMMQNLRFTQTLNSELIAEEIVRTLVGSLGLILAVPMTSLIASLAAERYAVSDAV